MFVLIASQGQEEGKVASGESSYHRLVIIHEAVAEGGSDVGDWGEAHQSKVFWCSEGSICEHGGGETKTASLDLVRVRTSVRCNRKRGTDGSKGEEPRKTSSTLGLAQIGAQGAHQAKVDGERNGRGVTQVERCERLQSAIRADSEVSLQLHFAGTTNECVSAEEGKLSKEEILDEGWHALSTQSRGHW